MNESVRMMASQLHGAANRLHKILIRSGPVRVRLGELRDAAEDFNRVAESHPLDPNVECTITNSLNQLGVFLVNSGTGLEQGGNTGYPSRAQAVTLAHLARWIEFFKGLGGAMESGETEVWLAQNGIPPGQPRVTANDLRLDD